MIFYYITFDCIVTVKVICFFTYNQWQIKI